MIRDQYKREKKGSINIHLGKLHLVGSSKSSGAGHVNVDVILISSVLIFSNSTVTYSVVDPSTVISYV